MFNKSLVYPSNELDCHDIISLKHVNEKMEKQERTTFDKLIDY